MEKETITLGEAQKEITKSLEGMKKGLEDLVGKKADESTVTKLAADVADAIKKSDAVATGAENLQKEILGLKSAQPKVEKSFAEGSVEAFAKHWEAIKKDDTKRSRRKDTFETVVKAPSTITSGYALVGSFTNLMRGFEMEPGVSKAPDRKTWVLDLIDVGRTSGHTIFWNERTLREGYAGQVAEGAAFPLMSTKYEKKSASSKKTGVYSKISEEMIEDVDFVQSEVQTEIMDSLPLVLDAQLLNGDGTGENHLGILSQSTAFAKPTGFDTLAAPNNYDVLRAAILQIQVEQFYPDAIVLHPADATNMELLKDSEGRYLPIPFVSTDGRIRGVQLVENTGVAVGSFLVGQFKKAKLFINRDITVRFWDQVGNDPIEDLMTVTGSLRGIFRIKGPDKKAFVKGTFAAARTAITTV